MVIDIQLLGGFRISVDGHLIESLTGNRSQSLIACLVLLASSAPLSRAYLSGLLWPDSTDPQARTNLRREIHKLRQSHVAIDQAIQADQNTLAWTPSAQCTVDVHRLWEQVDRLAAVDSVAKRLLFSTDLLQIYKGHLLPGVTDDWALEQRDEILRAYLSTCEQLGRLLVHDGETAKAERLFEEIIAHDPINESVWLALMELYLTAGDRARAVRTYHQYANALRSELDVAPSEPLRLLYRKLTEDHNEAGDPPAQRNRNLSAAGVSAPLVGRHGQQCELQALWDEAKQRGIKLVAIQGEAGIGKTRLADAFLAHCQKSGTAIARSRAYAAEGSLPFAPIRDWLKAEPVLKASQMLTTSARHLLGQVFPEVLTENVSFSKGKDHQNQRIETDPSLQRLAIFEAMADAITTSGVQLVLFLDDLQWCDSDTLQWIRFLHRHAPTCPILILTTVRSEALVEKHPVTSLITELSAHGQATSVIVNALRDRESRELMTHELKVAETRQSFSSEESNRILARAEGNPLFIVELVRAALSAHELNNSGTADTGLILTEKMYAVIQYRLSGVSDSTQLVARLAATVGRQFTDQLLIAASGLDEDAIVDAIDELWQRKLVRTESSGDYVFSHDYIREAVYAQLSPARRKKLHAQVVAGLKHVYESDLEQVTGELAAHCEYAGLTDEALQWYQKSAQQLGARFAYSEAKDNLEKGLALLDSIRGTPNQPERQMQILILLGNCEQVLSGFASPESQAICHHMQELLPQVKSLELRIDALERVRRYYGNVNVAEAIRLSEQLISLSLELGDDVKSLSAHRALGFSLFQTGDPVAADATMKQANLVVERTTQATMGSAENPHHEIPLGMGLWACVVAMRGHMDRSKEIDAQARNYPIGNIHVGAQIFIRHFRLQCAMLHHQLENVPEDVAWAADAARRHDHTMSRMVSLFYAGWSHSELGDHERAIDELTRAIAECRTLHSVMYMPQRWAVVASSQLALNQLDAAEHSLKDAFSIAKSTNQPFWQSELLRLMARLYQARSEHPDRIETLLSKAVSTAKKQGADLLWLRARLDQARWWVELTRVDEAERALRELIDEQTERGSCLELEEAVTLLAGLS